MSTFSLSRFEVEGYLPHTQVGFPVWQHELRAVLEGAGVEFTNGDRPGVQLRKGEA